MSRSFDLQTEIFKTLKSNTLLMETATGLYDRVQLAKKPVMFPYISWGPEQIIPESLSCYNMYEHYIQLDVWSISMGLKQCKNLCEIITDTLSDLVISVAGIDTAFLSVESVRFLHADEITHGVISLKAVMNDEPD